MSSSPTETSNQPAAGADPAPQPGADAIDVVMPQMGVSVAEGTIAGWLKAVGDQIAADEPVCEVTTDKIDVEIPAPVGGVVEEILVAEGETVVVGTVLARIGAGSTAVPAGPVRDVTPQAAADAGPAGPPDPGHPRKGRDAGVGVPDGVAHSSDGEIDRSSFYSPVVRRIASEHGVDLDAVEGHGVGGRVRKADVLALIEHPRAGTATATATATADRCTPSRRTGRIPSPRSTPARSRLSRRRATSRQRPRSRRPRRRPRPSASMSCSARAGASRWTRCVGRLPRTCSAAARRRRTARPWSRPTSPRSHASALRARRNWPAAACR